ncbi:YD repeat-containing protein [Micrococcales bacterium KH10]|nr:YD repeat-containing protein [Micrococcales bacterium KH10]
MSSRNGQQYRNFGMRGEARRFLSQAIAFLSTSLLVVTGLVVVPVSAHANNDDFGVQLRLTPSVNGGTYSWVGISQPTALTAELSGNYPSNATIEFVETSANQVVGTCSSLPICMHEFSPAVNGQFEYVARVGSNESAPVALTVVPWVLNLQVEGAGGYPPGPGGYVHWNVYSFRPVGGDTAVRLRGLLSGIDHGLCASTWSNLGVYGGWPGYGGYQFPVTATDYGCRYDRYTAYYQFELYQVYVYQNGQVVGVSNIVPLGTPSLPYRPDETTGGKNPSQHCSQNCVADPINTATGEYYENIVPLSVATHGPRLAWSMTYSTARNNDLGTLGYGWNHGYDMRLEAVDDLPVQQSEHIRVVQENGSAVYFEWRDWLSSWVTSGATFATLESLPNGSFEFSRKGQTSFRFDSSGRLVSIADRNSNELGFTYVADKLTEIENDSGQSITVTWSGDLIDEVTDHSGRSVQYAYNAQNELTVITFPDETSMSFDYDSRHRVIEKEDQLGGVTTNTYDTDGRVISQENPLGGVTSFSYTAEELAETETTVTHPDGSTTEFSYLLGQLRSRTEAPGTSQEATTLYEFGYTGQPITVTDPMGRITIHEYDDQGNRTETVDPLGRVTSATYDQWGNPLSVTDGEGNTSEFEYDLRGNLVRTIAPSGAVTEFDVDSRGLIVGATDPLDNESSYTYNSHGYQISSVDAADAVTTTTYDSVGNVLSRTDPRGNEPGADPDDYTTEFEYDVMGRLLSTMDPHGAVSEYEYDAAGNLLTSTNALNQVTTRTYDLAGRLKTVTTPRFATNEYSYDAMGRVVEETDRRGNITLYDYDVLGRVVATTNPLGDTTTFEYDLVGNLTA